MRGVEHNLEASEGPPSVGRWSDGMLDAGYWMLDAGFGF